ncbi:DUF2484 family protein [Profundibacterium mesophilum]|uniref:DUF2484 family protein n=1 Tax=Profundibacterium mesophilum KAUST100406-0324 TaxID=1037889 RepID=A0A921NXR5_9RHOB|nr:DUF2484 family protein [Profundibacterium mesophilum]KAF0675458.1 hypothetical protein PMES_02349 [Profundibacterium mesophilum KAUST100406-0324]
MTPSLIAACVWMITANVAALMPSRHGHWPAAIALMTVGLPLLGWTVLQNGPWIGLLVLGCGASLLRWPLYYGLRRVLRPRQGGAAAPAFAAE